jgi:hypothetical protein
MMPLSPGAKIGKLRAVIGASERRRQPPKSSTPIANADSEPHAVPSPRKIARIGWLTSEVAPLRIMARSTVRTRYAREAALISSRYELPPNQSGAMSGCAPSQHETTR